MAKIELKRPIVEEIKAKIDGASSVVLVDYRGLTVEEDTRLRKELREADVFYKIYKGTMINFAIKDTEFAPLEQNLFGPTAIAVTHGDATSAARILNNFSKKAKALELKAGIVEGEYYDQKGIQIIADIPSREVLLSKLLGSIKSPITNFARVVAAIADKQEQAN